MVAEQVICEHQLIQCSVNVDLTKRCSKCGESKPVSDFHRRLAANDGLYSNCKACVGKSGARYYARNQAHRLLIAKRWRTKNKKRRNVSQREGRLALKPYYVRSVLGWNDAPAEIVALKTLQLRLRRVRLQSRAR